MGRASRLVASHRKMAKSYPQEYLFLRMFFAVFLRKRPKTGTYVRKVFHIFHGKVHMNGGADPPAHHLGQGLHLAVDAPGRDKPRLLLSRQQRRVRRLSGLLQQVQAEGARLHHRGDAHRQDRHPQGGPVQGHPGVAHPRAGHDARVAELDGPADPLLPPGRQGIHRQHAGRTDLRHHGPQQFAALHAGAARHPRRQRGHWPEGERQMPGHQQMLRGPGSQGVRRDPAVAQPHHQHRPLPGQGGQQPQSRRHRPGMLADFFPLLGQGGQGQGEIGPPGLAHQGRALLGEDLHPGQGQALHFLLSGPDSGQFGQVLGGFLRQLLGFHGQVDFSALHPVFLPFSGHKMSCLGRGVPTMVRHSRGRERKYKKILKKSLQNSVLYAKIHSRTELLCQIMR